MTALSYTHGASDVPLLEETIGEHLRRSVERFGDREALDAFPMTVTGKIQKFRMRETAVEELALEPAAEFVTA